MTPSEILIAALSDFGAAEPDRCAVVWMTPEGQFAVRHTGETIDAIALLECAKLEAWREARGDA
jgi:hypothetical protein